MDNFKFLKEILLLDDIDVYEINRNKGLFTSFDTF